MTISLKNILEMVHLVKKHKKTPFEIFSFAIASMVLVLDTVFFAFAIPFFLLFLLVIFVHILSFFAGEQGDYFNVFSSFSVFDQTLLFLEEIFALKIVIIALIAKMFLLSFNALLSGFFGKNTTDVFLKKYICEKCYRYSLFSAGIFGALLFFVSVWHIFGEFFT